MTLPSSRDWIALVPVGRIASSPVQTLEAAQLLAEIAADGEVRILHGETGVLARRCVLSSGRRRM